MKFIFTFLMLLTMLNATIIIDNNSKTIDSFELSYYNDTTGSLGINDISKLDFNRTISNKFAFPLVKGRSWFKFIVVNNSNHEDFLLNLNEAWHDKVNLYTFKNKSIIQSKNGINILLKDKEVKDTTPTFNLHIKKGESSTFYIEIHTYNGTLGKFILYLDKDEFIKNKIISIGLYMFYLGASFIVVLLNLFLFFTLKERIYLYYSLYVFIFSSYMMVFSGISEYIYHSSFHILAFFSPLSTLLLLLFSTEILQTSRYTPKLHKLLISVSLIMLVLTLLVFWNSKFWFMHYNSFLPFAVSSIFFTSIIALKNGSKDAKYYMIFMLTYIIALFILVLLGTGIIEYNNFTRYSFIVASFSEISFFSLVLANRFNTTKKAKMMIEHTLEDTKELANRDGLTGLYNRHYLEVYSKICLNKARSRQQELCVIMLDIDKFKLVNDNYGHGIGDIVLGNVVNIFTSLTRQSDVVARYGGEEFIIILANTSLENAQTIAEKIRVNVEKMITLYEDDKELSITISLGISLLKSEDSSMETIITRADKALYKSKDGGRNRVSVVK